MNSKQLFFLIIIPFFFSCNQKASNPIDELKSIGKRMKENNCIEYSYKIEKYRSYSGQAPTRNGKIYFEKNLEDSIIGMNFYNKQAPFVTFYGGDCHVTMRKADSTAHRAPLVHFKNGHGVSLPFLEMSYCAIQLFLSKPDIELQIDSLVKNDTIFNNQACTYYSFWANEKFIDTHKAFDKYNKKVELIINNNSLPLYYSQYKPIMRNKNLDYHFTEAFFSNYSLESKYSSSLFRMENIPEYYTWDMYKSVRKTLANGQAAPDWTLPQLDGDSITLSDLKGKYVLLDFWFIGCGACIKSIPTLNEIQNSYRKHNLEVIGISTDLKNPEKIKEYCAKRGMLYRNLFNGNSISKKYKINAAPIFYLIDKKGTIVYTQIGHDSKKLKENIAKQLNKTAPNRGS
ncbi:TlpA family protein disulfide reductase [Marinifilum caeruleilacunae]|uniref:TlpA family protein disulfide reductase n=1 Tax=Marinifilum caeruleilacunae TaxID=2499076 RepID=A0ABX1X0Q2_9BACT|nr:TlpA disulfide reductase family protein [Marinifilum caeruleilacunae]NOU61994.1 TlpA family protein disulfide reductase [Marinifilum caeruleilacunae]